MAQHIDTFLLITVLLFATVLLIFAMKYFSAARTARARIAGDDALRDLAARAVEVQAAGAAALAGLTERVAGIEGRLGAIEKMLKDVE